MKLFSFLSRRDKVELLAIFLGGLVVVVFAFFMARGDLDAYVEVLLKESIPEEGGTPFSPEVLNEEVVEDQETLASFLTSPSPFTIPREEPPTIPLATEQPTTVPSPSFLPQPSPRATPRGTFYVQVGAFSKESNAQGMVATLKGLGYSGTIEKVSSLYRVRIYGFSSLEEAQKAVNRLRARGIEAFVSK
ncbi:MAG: SPOR domain-containing protein [Atribacterota bacterium]